MVIDPIITRIGEMIGPRVFDEWVAKGYMISDMAVVETSESGGILKFGAILSSGRAWQLARVVIHPHVVIEPGATIGNRAEIFPGSYIGNLRTRVQCLEPLAS
jgi:hypothetical protein